MTLEHLEVAPVLTNEQLESLRFQLLTPDHGGLLSAHAGYLQRRAEGALLESRTHHPNFSEPLHLRPKRPADIDETEGRSNCQGPDRKMVSRPSSRRPIAGWLRPRTPSVKLAP